MKKLIIITILFFLCSCTKQQSNELQKYNQYIEILNETNIVNEEYPFDINIELEQINEEEIMYLLTIDSPKEEMNNIEAIIIHNYKTEDSFPTSGIFEEKLNISPIIEYPKGILLAGFIKTKTNINELKIEFKCLIKYDNKEYFYIKQF